MDCLSHPKCPQVHLERNGVVVGGVGTYTCRGDDAETEAEAAEQFGVLICKPSRQRGS